MGPVSTGVKEVQLVSAASQEQPLAPAGAEVSMMFERLAKDPNVDVDKLERLIAMQERVMVHQSRAAFNTAFSAMQGELPTIVERAKTNNGSYATLEDIVDKVRPILQKHGFNLSHRTEWPDTKTVRVIGILTHEQGHERTSEFLSTADTSGNKNAIQGLGSAVSYGRRYTTKDLLNITTRGQDDDGGSVGRPEPPTGYDNWQDDMAMAADEGLPALTAAWNKSKKEFREFAGKFDREPWERLKKKAAKVKAS